MKTKSQITYLFALLIALPTSCLVAQTNAVQENVGYKEVIARHIETTGGKEANLKVKTMEVSGTIGVPQAGIEGSIQTVTKGSDSATKIVLPGLGTEKVGVREGVVWKVSDIQGPEIIDDQRKPMMLRQSKMNPLLSVDEDYDSVEVSGVEKFNGEDCYALVMKAKDEKPSYFYFSVKSGLLVGSKITQFDPMQGEMELVSRISDYREVNGIKVSHKSVVELPTGIQLVTQIETVKINEEIDGSKLELPAEIKELRDNQ